MVPPVSCPVASFESEVRPALQTLRASLARVIESLEPGVNRVVELQKMLDLDHHLSWSIFTAAKAENPLAVAMIVPGERAMAKFLDRARARGVQESVLTKASGALDEFAVLIKRYADSREMFEAMVAGLDPEGIGEMYDSDAKNKRAAFRAIAAIWGKQARQAIACEFYHITPTGVPERAFIRGIVGLRQTRPGVTLNFMFSSFATSNVSLAFDSVESFDKADGENADGLPEDLIRPFCSQSLPPFRVTEDADGNKSYQCTPRSLGAPGEFTVFFGRVFRGGSSPLDTEQPTLLLSRSFGIPMELAVSDILIYGPKYGELPAPRAEMYAAPPLVPGLTSLEQREPDLLPLRERVVYLGNGLDVARSPDLPRHAELIEYGCERLGWDASRVLIYRCRVDHPPLNSRLQIVLPR